MAMRRHEDAVDWLSTLAGETRARLLRLVRAAAASIGELAAALGISENAVRTHVAGLARDGLVRQSGVQRGTGGKPARLYELTTEAEELFPKAYGLVLAELVRAVREEEGEDAALELLRRVGRRLGARGASDEPRGPSGVAAAAALLESIGGSVEVMEEGSGWLLRSRGCPLSQVVAREPDACVLAESLVREATGAIVEEVCDRSARPRCGFRVRPREEGSPS